MDITLSHPVRQLVDHHPTIYNRFMVKPEYHKVIIPRMIDCLQSLTGCRMWINQYHFDLNGCEPILCLWLDCAVALGLDAQQSVYAEARNFGFSCAIWHEQTTNRTRISIWWVLPAAVVSALEVLEREWQNGLKQH